MKINFIGHSCFTIEEEDYSLIIDPFISGNPAAKVKVDDLKPTHILVSHAHGDHLGDAVELAKKTKVKVYTTNELGGELRDEGVDAVSGHIGGKVKTEFGSIKYFQAFHGSGLSGGFACGFIIDMGGKKIYHAGDTGLTKDMELLADENIDVAMLPIGDFYTMGPEDAGKAVKMIKPKYVIPMHYNTFPPIKQDPGAFANSVKQMTQIKPIVLNPGETFEL
ncbi:MAG: metal-dependent hydrolase [Clostridiales bacterium]|nr:metal-dependent hydrolase [Clostridiales bacterium]